MESEAIVVRRKIIGILMRAARERMRRTVNEVAESLSVTTARVRQYESGARQVTLPELEMLSLYLQTPLSFFLNGESDLTTETTHVLNADVSKLRRAMIAAKLKQVREV